MVAGLVAVALLPDFPSSGKQKWLTEQEQRFAEWRLARAANDEVDESGSIKEVLCDAFIDPKAWILIIIQVCQLSSQTWTYFFSTIAKMLGYSNNVTLLIIAQEASLCPHLLREPSCCPLSWQLISIG
ncbi:allantoate permease [Penicillium canescens]|nr:allantoate permease [Penicillium canescens]